MLSDLLFSASREPSRTCRRQTLWGGRVMAWGNSACRSRLWPCGGFLVRWYRQPGSGLSAAPKPARYFCLLTRERGHHLQVRAPLQDPALQVVAINASHQRIPLGRRGRRGWARAVGRPPCKDGVLTEAGGRRPRVWGAGGVALVRGQGRGTWGGRAAWEGRVQRGWRAGAPGSGARPPPRPQADVALAWGRAERTAAGGALVGCGASLAGCTRAAGLLSRAWGLG